MVCLGVRCDKDYAIVMEVERERYSSREQSTAGIHCERDGGARFSATTGRTGAVLICEKCQVAHCLLCRYYHGGELTPALTYKSKFMYSTNVKSINRARHSLYTSYPPPLFKAQCTDLKKTQAHSLATLRQQQTYTKKSNPNPPAPEIENETKRRSWTQQVIKKT